MKVVTLLLVLISCGLSTAQTAIPSQLRAQYTFNSLTDANGLGRGELLYGVPVPPGEIIGDYYLDSKWNRSKILLYEGEKILEGFPVMYNIKGEALEIKTRNGVKVLEARRILSLVWLDSITNDRRFFINGKEFTQNGSPLSGFLEVLADGTFPLLKRTTIAEKDPNYIAAFDVGTRDKKIYKKEVVFYAKGKGLVKVGNKKSLLQAFGEHSEEIEQFIKTNNLDVDEEDDLVKIFELYNSKSPVRVN